MLVLPQALVVPAGGQYIGVLPVAIQKPRVAHIRHVVRRRVEVDILIVVAVQKVGNIEGAGHREEAGEDVRMAQRDVHRVIPAKAAANADEVAVLILQPDQRKQLVEDVFLILDLPGYAPARWDVAVVPALRIERVDAVELDLSVVDLVPDRADHAAIFELIEARLRAGEDNGRRAAVSVDKEFHIPAKTL